MVIFLIAPHAHAVAHKQPLASMLLSIGFSIVFCLTLLFVLLLFTNFIVDGLIGIIRMWSPNFMVYQHPSNNRADARVVRADVRKVALDFMMDQRRAAQRPIPQRFAPSLMTAPEPLNTPVPKPKQDALYALCRFRNGQLDQPEYLCRKHSTRGGLRTAWANLPAERLLMPREVCTRWLSILPAAILVPVGATARQEVAADLEILRSFEFEELQRSADYVQA